MHQRGFGAVQLLQPLQLAAPGLQYVPAPPTGCPVHVKVALFQLKLPSPLTGWAGWKSFPVPSVRYPWSLNWLGSVTHVAPDGVLSRKDPIKFHILVVDGRLPLMKLLREGEHTGWLQNAASKTSDSLASFASFARLGACTLSWPY